LVNFLNYAFMHEGPSAADVGARCELSELVHSRNLLYPIRNKADFLSQMLSGGPVIYKGTPYDPGYASSLVPAFFFPVNSEEEMIARATELMISRGHLPVSSQPTPL
jgi:hypothetical protein